MKNNNTIHPFGRNLRKLRRQKGYTQTELAKLAGVTLRVIEHYENHAKRPTIEKAKKIAAALGISDEELLGTKPLLKNKIDEEVSYKIMKTIRLIETFSVREQQQVYNLINSIAEKRKQKNENKKE